MKSYSRKHLTLARQLFATPVLVSLTACGGGSALPVPTTPVLRGVSVAGQPANIGTMPIQGASSQHIVVTLAAPFPGDLSVTISPPGPGTTVERVVNSPARERQLADNGTPFFVVEDVDVNQNPAVWRMRVSPPPVHQCALMPFVVGISHVVSGNASGPLHIGFTHAQVFNVIGTSGRVVSLRKPNCTAIEGVRIDRRASGGIFTPVATFARGDPRTFYRDTGLTPSTTFEYRLALVRDIGSGMPPVDIGAVTASATTTALMTGSMQVSATQPDQSSDAHLWRTATFDPLVSPGGVTVTVGAVIERVQNDGNRNIFVTFQDRNGARVSAVEVAARSSVTAPFAGMLVEGSWDPIRTTGSAVGLPSVWPLTVFWAEP